MIELQKKIVEYREQNQGKKPRVILISSDIMLELMHLTFPSLTRKNLRFYNIPVFEVMFPEENFIGLF